MALTGPQKVTVAEITRETYQTIDSLASSLTSDQETSIGADCVTWATIRNKGSVRVSGGSDGTDYNIDRQKDEIRKRVRKAFGLTLVSDEEVEPSSGAVRTVWVY